ncbi:hypothetical protein [Novosphingobium mangrovi (ex Huang et al. 2023)]|uniref:Uncharacterized protein n=1 Tax=Novosphingobium mangrovi (ex Huang et al. 2023) TaxID=2976432 RepID=A0ABT2I113_9SPHN|nr:hypothetical protein [Novosphingobium mangrovi (ex Huang et al. 2023)]MCT2398485.1 hypothetical protein [Novosphingobium mangrovi (ex Huang et al. 2023)]
MMRGKAKERIPFGALVLCRGFSVTLAPPEIANGIARSKPAWAGREDEAYHAGDYLHIDPVDGLGQRDLQAIADGPIMEPSRLFLPAGRISENEYQERLDLQFHDAGIDASERP